MLLNLNSKFKFFLTTTFLFSSPDTLALHLSVSIDDKESPISESLIIKDVISIGAVPFKVIRTELPPEFNGAVNGIPEVAAESPEFTGGVNDMEPPILEIPEYKGCITNCSDAHREEVSKPYEIYNKIDYGTVDVAKVVNAEAEKVVDVAKKVVDGVAVAVDKEADAPKILYEKGSPEIHSKIEFTGPVNGIPEEAEYPEFNGGVNGDKDGEADFQDRLPVVTYVSITAVPSNAPIMDKPEYIGGSSDLPVTNKTKYIEPRQSLSQQKLEENNSILLKHQFNKLRSLQTYCIANKNEFCYGIRHHYMAKNDIHDNLLGLRLGYGITNKLTLGINIERSLENHLSNNYRTLHNNVGIGAFAHYKLPSNSYVLAGIAKNNNSYLAPPPPYFNNSVTRYKGISWNLTLGQDLTLSNKNSLGWYLSYRNTQIKQNGYDAPASQFLMKYNNIKWTDHSLASGIKWNYSITTKLTWLNNIEIEHQIKSNVTGAVQIENLKHDYHLNIHKTQWSISSGLNYQFSPKFSVSLTPYIKNGLISSKQWGTYLSLEGKF